MDLAKYAVTAVVVEGRSLRSVAASTGRSKSWVGRHVQLYREGGDEALEPKKRGPVTAKNRTSAVLEDAIVAMRKELTDQGWDAGARTIQWHLNESGADAPALATIHRVLQRRGFVTPQPQKRPRSSCIRFKHGKPYHPQTQGKVERYHLTLKKWLRKQPGAASIEELQSQIDGFVKYYNEKRPHQARNCPPMRAWRELDKATPEIDGQPLLAKTRVRHDHVDRWGAVTLRYRRKLHHIGVGRPNRGKRVIILMADLDVRVIDEDSVLLRHFELDPSVDYQAKSRDII